jgi:hypothetical protein
MLVVSVVIVPVPVVSVLMAPDPSEVTVVESVVVLVSPPPHAANAANTNTKSSFFIVSLFIVNG